MQVQIDALEQMLKVVNTVATPLEDLDLVIEALHETAVFSADEIVGDLFPPGLEQLQEIIETVQATFLYFLGPALDFGLGLGLGQVHVKEGGELFA